MSSNNDDQITFTQNNKPSFLSGFKDMFVNNKKVFIIIFIVLLVILFVYICREKVFNNSDIVPSSSLKEKIAEFNQIQNQNIKSLGK